MLPSAAADVGRALAACLALAAGASVQIELRQCRRRFLRPAQGPVVRVTVRTRSGAEFTITAATPVVALHQAAAKLRAATEYADGGKCPAAAGAGSPGGG
jgi:hypothetical protein